jgi:hypothetical protein
MPVYIADEPIFNPVLLRRSNMDYIFDIDGTLLDITHRLEFIESTPRGKKDYVRFRDPELKKSDKPILPVIYIMNALHYEGHQIIIATGRRGYTQKSCSACSLYHRDGSGWRSGLLDSNVSAF